MLAMGQWLVPYERPRTFPLHGLQSCRRRAAGLPGSSAAAAGLEAATDTTMLLPHTLSKQQGNIAAYIN